MRWRVFLLGTLALFLLLPGSIRAEEGGDDWTSDEFRRSFEALLEESGANELFPLLPEESQELLRENGISGIDPEAILDLSFWELLQGGWTALKSAAAQPLSTLAISLGVILLCALLNAMKTSVGGQERLFSAVSALCVSASVAAPAVRMIQRSTALLEEMSKFLLGFVPVYTGLVTASGKPVSGAVYNACLLGTAEVIARLAATALAPLLGIYLALCLIGAASREVDMQPVSKLVQNGAVTLLTLLLTVFVGLLSVQGTVAAAADTVTTKTLKFAVSSFVPVVGGALGEAMNTVQGGLGLIRSAVGGFGILAAAAAFLPELLSILMMQLALSAAGAAADVLGVKEAGGLMKSASSVLSLLAGMLMVFGMLFVVSLSLMMAMSA